MVAGARRFCNFRTLFSGHPVSFADQILAGVILASQHTPLKARGGYTNRAPRPIDKAKAEADDYPRFFGFFPGVDPAAELAGKDVLDFGSGYGGRTVEYARRFGPHHVSGTEPDEVHVQAGRDLAAEYAIGNVSFDLCTQERIPYPDASFDVALTFDVLEHVADPRVSFAELYRVMRPAGVLFAVFPLYRGMFAHHLDYITLAPALHLIFSPDRIMRVVNKLLDQPRFSEILTTRHPSAVTNYQGRRVLPVLNGMGLREFKDAARKFEVVSARLNSTADVGLGRSSLIARAMRPLMKAPPAISEVFAFNIACILRKPASH